MIPGERFALVLKGGSTKGLSYLGALAVLYAHGYVPTVVVGSSAGALTAFFLAYVHAVARGNDTKPTDELPTCLDELATLDPAAEFFGFRLGASFFLGFRLLWKGHLSPGRGLERWLKEHLSRLKQPRPETWTLAELEARSSLPLLLALSSTSDGLGLAKPDARVIDAVRGSSALPFALEPVKASRKDAGRSETWIDGGLLQNLPIRLYEDARKGDKELPERYLALHLQPTAGDAETNGAPRASTPERRPGFLVELVGLALLAVGYVGPFAPGLALTQSVSSARPLHYMALLALRAIFYALTGFGVLLVARRLVVALTNAGVLRTVAHLQRAVAAQNEAEVLSEAKTKGQLICIETGTDIGTFTLVLSESQRRRLILSGAKAAFDWIEEQAQQGQWGQGLNDVVLPLPERAPGSPEKRWSKGQIEKALSEVSGQSGGLSLRMWGHLAAGVAPVVVAIVVLVASIQWLLFDPRHHLGGPEKSQSVVMAMHSRIAEGCSPSEDTRTLGASAHPGGAGGRRDARPEPPSCVTECTEQGGDPSCCEGECPTDANSPLNACYQKAAFALCTKDSSLQDCFYVGGGVFPASVVETLCWAHFCAGGKCDEEFPRDCRKQARELMTADAANDCVAALALQQKGWKLPFLRQ